MMGSLLILVFYYARRGYYLVYFIISLASRIGALEAKRLGKKHSKNKKVGSCFVMFGNKTIGAVLIGVLILGGLLTPALGTTSVPPGFRGLVFNRFGMALNSKL